MTTPTASITRASWIWHILIFAAVFLLSFGMAVGISRLLTLAEPWEFRLRTTGGLLQVFGVLSVALGIWKLRRSFGLGPVSGEILNEFRDWILELGRRIARIFRCRGDVRVALTGANLQMTGSLSARLNIGRGSNLSVEERLKLLERGFDYVQELTHKLQDDLQNEVDSRAAAIAAERADREKHTAEVRSQVKELAVGGIQLQIVGILWLLFGVLLATWSQEIARLFGC